MYVMGPYAYQQMIHKCNITHVAKYVCEILFCARSANTSSHNVKTEAYVLQILSHETFPSHMFLHSGAT